MTPSGPLLLAGVVVGLGLWYWLRWVVQALGQSVMLAERATLAVLASGPVERSELNILASLGYTDGGRPCVSGYVLRAALYRLERRAYVASRWEGARRLYRLTGLAERYLRP